MARPERPVQGSGPVADLARELRRIRSAAGLSYREMSPAANFSKETLSAAARGDQCPSWDVTRAYADACDQTGTESRRLRQLWDKASKADRRRRVPARRQVPPAAQPGAARRDPARGAPRPDPDGSPADFVYQLRVLWEWAGKPGPAVTRQRGGPRLPSSTMYDALSLARTTLPPLRTVRLIVLACLDDEDAAAEWDSAWRVISVREFTAAHPRPAPAQPADRNRAPLRIVASQ